MKALHGKTILITGASSGIGHATALLFAAEGARVVLGARRGDRLEALSSRIRAEGGSATWLAGDVREEAYAQALVRHAEETYGPLDAAFNNAGTLGPLQPTPDVALHDWQNALDVNLTGAFLGAKHQIPSLLRNGNGGSLVFTSTVVGHTTGFPCTAAYAASKAGVIGLVHALATEFGPAGVRVNALLPGGTDTPMAREMNPDEAALGAVARLHALRRLARPEEIAAAALFLVSPASSFVTGSAMRVDGGVSVQRG
ncbi:SDR family oxidoreductase [Stenotrophomonas sp. NLF4-10]|uniref:SDR family oxidoreductase n=1 Tax=Stenotrophomonas sp. NLF4-10 TaxID=2918754 RepID=UPI001EFAD25D|nr:SDR family oxidoreductase [Stenotrophomonas sp. NLF4-10]MCG8276659.1 SDR family oxidoreductase [Stenotrophomonas sp. NLF4-10]